MDCLSLGHYRYNNSDWVLLECFDINQEFGVASFHVQIFSKNEEPNNFQNEGGCYNRDVKSAFEKLFSGDSVKISDIIIWSNNSTMRAINRTMDLIVE